MTRTWFAKSGFMIEGKRCRDSQQGSERVKPGPEQETEQQNRQKRSKLSVVLAEASEGVDEVERELRGGV